MKLRRFIALMSTAALLSALFATSAGVVLAAAAVDSPNPVQSDTTQLNWTGQGVSEAGAIQEKCDPADFGRAGQANGAEPDNYLLWIFSTDGGNVSGAPTLTVDGTTYTDVTQVSGSLWQIVTPGPIPDEAYATFEVGNTGNGAWVLTISHGCTGDVPGEEELTVTKTVVTTFDRQHFWDITKKVETENEHEHNELPKIWLYTDGSGDETATWTVDVTYEGYEDSGHNVSGTITIENTGPVAATITDILDLLDGTVVDVDCDFDNEPPGLPYTLAAGATLECTYDEDLDGETDEGAFNQAFVTTLESVYSSDEVDIVWGDPENETNKTVNVEDISDLFGTVALGSVTAPNGDSFTYTKDFAWDDYGADNCGDHSYDNTATIVETEQSADATLLVNVQCFLSESAWAKGDPNHATDGPTSADVRCFTEDGFANWGWTNKINVTGTYTWTLWAGAAMCDTSKGFDAGTVTFDYDKGTGAVTNIVYTPNDGYDFEDSRLYSGSKKYPKLGNRDTVAPGQYKNNGGKPGSHAWVIAHTNVLYPDPNFGP